MKKYLLLLALAACSPQKPAMLPPDANTTEEAPQDHKLIIYQLMTRLFGNQTTANQPYGTIQQNGVGKFNDITDQALQAIKRMGVSHVWYTGVLDHATMTGLRSHNDGTSEHSPIPSPSAHIQEVICAGVAWNACAA